jgi:hypothetical protein
VANRPAKSLAATLREFANHNDPRWLTPLAALFPHNSGQKNRTDEPSAAPAFSRPRLANPGARSVQRFHAAFFVGFILDSFTKSSLRMEKSDSG